MTVEDFQKTFSQEIEEFLERIERQYRVTVDEMAATLHASVKKYLPGTLAEDGSVLPTVRQALVEYLASLNSDDLCHAVACAKGDDEAWEDFFRDYRSYLVNVARTMTQDASAAEQLADSTFAELYGLRETESGRVSKFSFYSGRGSLRGWLRAVVFQLSADSHRQTSRFVQTEEPEDMDRLAGLPDNSERALDDLTHELPYVRKRYQEAVADALRRALSEMEARDRLLLAYYYYDEMTLKEIGQLFAVHEATISRWLTKVQKRARKLVEKSLGRDHGFKRREISEAMELAAEQMDINVREYLVEAAASDSPTERRKSIKA